MPTKLITLGELIDKTWDHYRANFVDLLSVSGWILAVSVIDVIALSLYPKASRLADPSVSLTGTETAGIILSFFSTAVIGPLLGLWIFIALARLIRAQVTPGVKADVKKAMKDGLTLFWPAFYVSLLVLLILLGGLAIGVLPAFVVAALAQAAGAPGVLLAISSVLLAIGIGVAFVLDFKWGVEYVLSPYALFLEDLRGASALRRSRELIRGRFWASFARMLLPKLVFIAVGAITMAILVYFTNILVSGAAGLNLDLQLRLGSILNAVYPVLIAAVLNPLLITVDILLFRSLAAGRRA